MSTEAQDTPSTSPATTTTTKRIFLIRHAESQNNVAKREAKNAWRRLKRFKGLPTCREWYLISTLLLVPMNTDLSDEGERMVTLLRDQLQANNFLEKEKIDLIVHSHLIRAKRTCLEIFNYTATSKNDSDSDTKLSSTVPSSSSSSTLPPIIEHSHLFEKNISEHFSSCTGASIAVRTEAFRQWLLQRQESNIVVVGHSAFFRDLLDISNDCNKMNNCEIRRVCLDINSGTFHSSEIVIHGGLSLLETGNK